MPDPYDETALTPEQRDIRIRFFAPIREAFHVLLDSRIQFDNMDDEGLLDDALRRIIENDVDHAIEEIRFLWPDPWDDEQDDVAGGGASFATGRGPATSGAAAPDVPNPAPISVTERLKKFREKHLARAGRGEPGPPVPP